MFKLLRRVTGISYVTNKYKRFKSDANVKFQIAKENVVKGGIVALILGFIVWLSIFIYIVFYYTYIPPVIHTRPVHLQFNTCDNQESTICSFPSAYIQLTRRQQLLMVGQRYSVTLELELPESEENEKQGMFLSCAELTSADGTLLSYGCRTAMLPYTSWFLRLLRTAIFAPAYLLGSSRESQTVRIDVITDFVDDKIKSATFAYIEIRSRRLQIYSAKLQISANFSGLRHLMYHWPTISGLAGVGLVLGTLLMTLGLSWQQVALQDGTVARAARRFRDRLAAFADETEFDDEDDDHFDDAELSKENLNEEDDEDDDGRYDGATSSKID